MKSDTGQSRRHQRPNTPWIALIVPRAGGEDMPPGESFLSREDGAGGCFIRSDLPLNSFSNQNFENCARRNSRVGPTMSSEMSGGKNTLNETNSIPDFKLHLKRIVWSGMANILGQDQRIPPIAVCFSPFTLQLISPSPGTQTLETYV